MPAPKIRCVVIDTDRDFLVKVQRWFVATYPEVELTPFASQIEAVEFLRRHGADFVVTAYLMPQIDGLQLTSIIRSFDSGVPLFMMSRLPVRDAALAQGATGFCPKADVWSLFNAEVANRLNAAVAA